MSKLQQDLSLEKVGEPAYCLRVSKWSSTLQDDYYDKLCQMIDSHLFLRVLKNPLETHCAILILMSGLNELKETCEAAKGFDKLSIRVLL